MTRGATTAAPFAPDSRTAFVRGCDVNAAIHDLRGEIAEMSFGGVESVDPVKGQDPVTVGYRDGGGLCQRSQVRCGRLRAGLVETTPKMRERRDRMV